MPPPPPSQQMHISVYVHVRNNIYKAVSSGVNEYAVCDRIMFDCSYVWLRFKISFIQTSPVCAKCMQSSIVYSNIIHSSDIVNHQRASRSWIHSSMCFLFSRHHFYPSRFHVSVLPLSISHWGATLRDDTSGRWPCRERRRGTCVRWRSTSESWWSSSCRVQDSEPSKTGNWRHHLLVGR